jgi:hypothetical protein
MSRRFPCYPGFWSTPLQSSYYPLWAHPIRKQHRSSLNSEHTLLWEQHDIVIQAQLPSKLVLRRSGQSLARHILLIFYFSHIDWF